MELGVEAGCRETETVAYRDLDGLSVFIVHLSVIMLYWAKIVDERRVLTIVHDLLENSALCNPFKSASSTIVISATTTPLTTSAGVRTSPLRALLPKSSRSHRHALTALGCVRRAPGALEHTRVCARAIGIRRGGS